MPARDRKRVKVTILRAATPPPTADKASVTALTSAMEGLMTSAETADCSVVVDGAETRCHKAVLAAASTWFHRALFEVPMREREEGVVTLKGVKFEAWECMHRFIYTRKFSGDEYIAKDVLDAAVLYEVPDLIDATMSTLLDQAATPEWAASTWLFGSGQPSSPPHRRLAAAAFACMTRDFPRLPPGAFSWLPEEAQVRLLRSDDLGESDETEVLGTVLDAICDLVTPASLATLQRLLREVRFACVKRQAVADLFAGVHYELSMPDCPRSMRVELDAALLAAYRASVDPRWRRLAIVARPRADAPAWTLLTAVGTARDAPPGPAQDLVVRGSTWRLVADPGTWGGGGGGGEGGGASIAATLHRVRDMDTDEEAELYAPAVVAVTATFFFWDATVVTAAAPTAETAADDHTHRVVTHPRQRVGSVLAVSMPVPPALARLPVFGVGVTVQA